MNNWFEIINEALFHYVQSPFWVLIAILVVIVALAVAFAIREIKNGTS